MKAGSGTYDGGVTRAVNVRNGCTFSYQYHKKTTLDNYWYMAQ